MSFQEQCYRKSLSANDRKYSSIWSQALTLNVEYRKITSKDIKVKYYEIVYFIRGYGMIWERIKFYRDALK